MSQSKESNGVAEYQKVPSNENQIDTNEDSNIPDTYGYGVRHIQVLLGFMCLSVAYIGRAHIGVTVVAMTNTLDTHTYLPLNQHKNVTRDIVSSDSTWRDVDRVNIMADEDFEKENGTFGKLMRKERSLPQDTSIFKKYDWPKSTQEMVLGAFFLGYNIMMIPMGIVCQKWGAKVSLQIGMFVNGVASLISPWMAAWGGWKAVCACRIFQGMSQAGFYPGLQLFVSKWASPSERGRFYSWVFTGSTFGTILAFQGAGLLATMGWPYIFWVTGSVCLLTFFILTIFGAASPADHKSISDLERKFITRLAHAEKKKKKTVPLKAILTSKYVWAAWCAHAGSGVPFVFFFSQTPTYIHYILGVDVKKSGLISSLPYIASALSSFFYGWFSDWLTNRNILSIQNSRKVFNSYGQYGTAICFIAVCYTESVELAVFCLVMLMACQTAQHTGWMVNYIDLSPNFSGSIMSYGNTIGSACVLTLPLLVSFIVTDVTNQFQWRIMFLTMAAVVAISNTVFILFMSADRQPWDSDGYETTDTEEHKIKEELSKNV